eukprot:TRINITY_DN2857_c0_g1_i1.p1 TRINITY_DN2857_c0_g1~~TRINITY_DN2857_c0_g1_i1.p1  ORF type:complete len:486 (+),score=203.08 TRINITY_DN2857_c0_g1_i1:75-1460(+)
MKQEQEKAPLQRSQTTARWIILPLACLAMIGSYYCYDNPGALKDQLQKEFGLSDVQYNLLYTVYSIPNVILPLFGGFFVDRLGTNITLFVFCALIAGGQAVFALGVSTASYPIMLVGRVLFGFGGESLSVAQSTLVALWFQDKELALALGINLSVSRLGSVINDNVSPIMYDHRGLSGAMWFGFAVTIASLCSTLLVIVVDRRVAAELAKNQSQVNGVPETDPPVRLSDLKNMSLLYWLIALSCVIVYSAILPFNGICSGLMQSKFNYDLHGANALMGIPFTMSAIASPFLGGAVDRFGWRAALLCFSSILLTLAHLLLAGTTITPILALVLIGAGYSIYAAAMWPSISYVVQKNQLGTAYGLATAVQNAGLAAAPAIVGAIKDSTGSYTWVEIFFAILAALGVCIGVLLNIIDTSKGRILNKSYYKSSDDKGASAPLLSNESTPPNQVAVDMRNHASGQN